MTNWVERIETAMEDCPSAEELEKEKLEDELGSKIPGGNTNPQS